MGHGWPKMELRMSAVPINRTHIDTRPRLKVVQGVMPSVAKQIATASFAFCAIAAVVFSASSLSGHVAVENARREGIRAQQRLTSARAAQSVLVNQLAQASNRDDLVVWAKRNGFVAADMAPKTSRNSGVLVASR